MRPSEALARHRDEVLKVLARYPVSNPRVFGSAARGEDAEGSDLDMLVHVEGRVGYFELANLALELERLLGCKVDLGEDTSIRSYAKDGIEADARSI
jgi:predicted nucleotidyltransferase